MGDDTAALSDCLLCLIQNRIRSLAWIGDDDGLLDVDGDGSGDDAEDSNEEGEESHGCDARVSHDM